MPSLTKESHRVYVTIALILALAAITRTRADTLISDFAAADCVQGRYGSWEDVEPLRRDGVWAITAKGFGGAFKNITPPRIDARAESVIELTVRIENPDPASAEVIAGPLVVLEDVEGNQSIWAWYGLGAGRHVLLKNLCAPTMNKPPGSAAGLNFSKLTAFHIQVDPGQSTAAYRIVFEKLRLIPTMK